MTLLIKYMVVHEKMIYSPASRLWFEWKTRSKPEGSPDWVF